MDFVAFGSDKPVSSRLELQFREYLEGPLPKAAPRIQPASTEGCIEVERFGRLEPVPLEDVLFIEADGDYSVLVRRDGRRVDHYKPIGLIEAALPPTFARIHKSYLVRLATVARVTTEPGSRCFAVLVTGQRLPVSRSRYRDLLALLGAKP